MEPLNVRREDFPMSKASVSGMIPLQSKPDNYEIYYYDDVVYAIRGERKLHLQIIGPRDAGDNLPCIFFIPGSAFREQNVKDRVPSLTYLANRGFPMASVHWKRKIHVVKNRWLRALLTCLDQPILPQ